MLESSLVAGKFPTRNLVHTELTVRRLIECGQVGWMSAAPMVDTTTQMYQVFRSQYDAAIDANTCATQCTSKGSLIPGTTTGCTPDSVPECASEPTFYSTAVFNGVYAVARATTELYIRSVFSTNPEFGFRLRDAILRSNFPGAGIDLRFEASGQIFLEYEVLNYEIPGLTPCHECLDALCGSVLSSSSVISCV